MKRYLLLAVFGTLVRWTAWALVLMYINPFASGFIGLTSFYLSLFLALVGTFSLLGFAFRRTFARDRIAFHLIGVSVRQGVFLACIAVGALLLRGTDLYRWWNVLLLIAGFSVLESFFLTREST